MKKVWEKPKLVVLVRDKLQERVLAVCKGEGLEGPDGMDCFATDLAAALPCEDPSLT